MEDSGWWILRIPQHWASLSRVPSRGVKQPRWSQRVLCVNVRWRTMGKNANITLWYFDCYCYCFPTYTSMWLKKSNTFNQEGVYKYFNLFICFPFLGALWKFLQRVQDRSVLTRCPSANQVSLAVVPAARCCVCRPGLAEVCSCHGAVRVSHDRGMCKTCIIFWTFCCPIKAIIRTVCHFIMPSPMPSVNRCICTFFQRGYVQFITLYLWSWI